MGATTSQSSTSTTYSDILSSVLSESTANCSLNSSSSNNLVISGSTLKNTNIKQTTSSSLECLLGSSKKASTIADATNKVLNDLDSKLGSISVYQSNKQNVKNEVSNKVTQYMTDKNLTNLSSILKQNNNLEITKSDLDTVVIVQKAENSAKLVSQYFSDLMTKDGISNDIDTKNSSETENQVAPVVDSLGKGLSGIVDSAGNVLMTPLYYILGFVILLILLVVLYNSFGSSSAPQNVVYYRDIPPQPVNVLQQ